MNQRQLEVAQRVMESLGVSPGERHNSKDSWPRVQALGLNPIPRFLFSDAYRVSRGVYVWPSLDSTQQATVAREKVAPQARAVAQLERAVADASSGTATISSRFDKVIPQVSKGYIPFGSAYRVVASAIASKRWFPIIITGDAGNGKTKMVEQACARAGREFYRVNFNANTDEGDLIGEKTINNGNVFFEEGPALNAMRRGGVLLLDELDYATPQGYTAIQSIAEGGSYLNKKTGEIIHPAPGFTIVATMNTRGRGDTKGKYNGAGLLNSAFLDRFLMTLDQAPPTPEEETPILRAVLRGNGVALTSKVNAVLSHVVKWTGQIRRSYEQQAIEETVSLRRSVNLITALCHLPISVEDVVRYSVNRYEQTTAEAMVRVFSQLHDADKYDMKKPLFELSLGEAEVVGETDEQGTNDESDALGKDHTSAGWQASTASQSTSRWA